MDNSQDKQEDNYKQNSSPYDYVKDEISMDPTVQYSRFKRKMVMRQIILDNQDMLTPSENTKMDRCHNIADVGLTGWVSMWAFTLYQTYLIYAGKKFANPEFVRKLVTVNVVMTLAGSATLLNLLFWVDKMSKKYLYPLTDSQLANFYKYKPYVIRYYSGDKLP